MKKFVSLLLVIAMIFGICPAVFAANTNDYTSGTQVEFLGNGTVSWTVTVPAQLVPGSSGTVTAQGTWDAFSTLYVTSDTSVTLTNSLNQDEQRVLDVTFNGIVLQGSDIESVMATETVSVSSISNVLFGVWSGKFNYNVEFDANAALPEEGKTAEEYTWEEIKLISSSGKASEYFKLGDTKTLVTEDGESIVVEIVGIDEDVRADGAGMAGISWASQITIAERQMHPSATINSWVDSETRRWLQEDFYQTLPDDVKSAIVNVNKTYYDNEDQTTKTCVDSLWIPSYREIFGNPNNVTNFETEGPDYTEFFSSENERVRYTLDGSDAYWWVRTAAYNRPVGYFYSVNKISYFGAATMTAGILLCFCT